MFAKGFNQDTLGHALVTGALRHLVMLEVRPADRLDPGYLDSDVYRWCTPGLENLMASLGKSKAARRSMLEERKFFVNVPKIRRLFVNIETQSHGEAVLKDIPQSVTELSVYWSTQTGARLPAVLQPGLEKLSLEGFRGGEDYYGNVTRPVVGDLNLQYRHALFVLLLTYSVRNT